MNIKSNKNNNMKIQTTLTSICLATLLFSCVSNKKYAAMQAAAQKRFDSLSTEYAALQNKLKSCNDQTSELTTQKTNMQTQIDDLNKQVALLKENNTVALKQLQDMSVISASQAESI